MRPRPNGHSPAIARSSVLLPSPEAPVISSGLPGLRRQRDVRAQHSPVRQIEIERVDLDTAAATFDFDRLRRASRSAAISFDFLAEPGEPLHHRLVFGDFRV